MSSGATQGSIDQEWTTPPSVLHVDDDEVFLDLTRGVLQQEGVEVASESDPRAVLDRLDGLAVDAVVSDYEMPEMDGEALFERVRQHHPSLPFVLFTGKDRDDLSIDLAGEASWYVQKRGSGGYDRLVSVVQDVVEYAPDAAGQGRSHD